MIVTYVRYELTTGRYIAKGTRDSTDPPVVPRDIFEDIKYLSPAEVDQVIARPQAFRYDNLTPEPLYEGEFLASTDRFYPDVANFEDLYPTLENTVYLMARFPGMPQGVPIAVRLNNQEITLENYDETPFELKSEGVGLFVATLTDPRCYVEQRTLYLNCLSIPTE